VTSKKQVQIMNILESRKYIILLIMLGFQCSILTAITASAQVVRGPLIAPVQPPPMPIPSPSVATPFTVIEGGAVKKVAETTLIDTIGGFFVRRLAGPIAVAAAILIPDTLGDGTMKREERAPRPKFCLEQDRERRLCNMLPPEYKYENIFEALNDIKTKTGNQDLGIDPASMRKPSSRKTEECPQNGIQFTVKNPEGSHEGVITCCTCCEKAQSIEFQRLCDHTLYRKKTCDDEHPNYPTGNELPGWYEFGSEQAATVAFQRKFGKQINKDKTGKVADDGPCIGLGRHKNVFADSGRKKHIGDVVGCPFCKDTKEGPQISTDQWRWGFIQRNPKYWSDRR